MGKYTPDRSYPAIPKPGDLVNYKLSGPLSPMCPALVIDFVECKHPKEKQRLRVTTSSGIQTWYVQYCEVINESN